MKKKLLIFFAIIIIPYLTNGQDMSEKLSKKICTCLEKEKIKSTEKMEQCFEKILISNLEEIYKVYKIKSLDDFDFEKLGIDIGVKLMKNCDYAMENLTNVENKFDEDFISNKDLDCTEFKNGEFYYLLPNPTSNRIDTTFVTIKNKMYLERMNHGRSYSLLDINWVSDCKFNLVFKDSNDNYKNTLSEPGDIYKYEIISSTTNSFILKLFWGKQEYKIDFYKVKQ
tara:strand:- start:329 stop:1006 length:678 start_codon:yes stop_codon:yes gene_type:complete